MRQRFNGIRDGGAIIFLQDIFACAHWTDAGLTIVEGDVDR